MTDELRIPRGGKTHHNLWDGKDGHPGFDKVFGAGKNMFRKILAAKCRRCNATLAAHGSANLKKHM